jgi:hypothetical protein
VANEGGLPKDATFFKHGLILRREVKKVDYGLFVKHGKLSHPSLHHL